MGLGAAGVPSAIDGAEGQGPWAGSVLDGYDFSGTEIAAVATKASPLVALDDYLAPVQQAQLVINAAPGLEGDTLNGVPALLGPRYALLDSRFADRKPRSISREIEHVVVTVGRNDPANFIAKVLGALAEVGHLWRRCTAVVGPTAAQQAPFLSAVEALSGRVRVLTAVEDMAELYDSADLCLGAGGVGLLERMACGAPSLTLVTAENQARQVEGAAALGAIVSMGSAGSLPQGELAYAVSAIAKDVGLRARLAETGRRAVDGRGAERVAAAMMQLAGRPRPSALQEP